MNNKFSVGDTVFIASFQNKQIKVVCPICYGKLKVTLILGNGEQAILECNYCGKGFGEPRGVVEEYEYVAEARTGIIERIEIEVTASGEKYKYHFYDNCYLDEDELFTDKGAALEKANLKALDYQKEQDTRAEYLKQNSKKSYSWNAGYHGRAIKKAKKDIEYHERKMEICKARSKDDDSEKENLTKLPF